MVLFFDPKTGRVGPTETLKAESGDSRRPKAQPTDVASRDDSVTPSAFTGVEPKVTHVSFQEALTHLCASKSAYTARVISPTFVHEYFAVAKSWISCRHVSSRRYSSPEK